MANRLRRRQDDHGTPRPAHPPLRDHRDRQRKLALQEPSIAQTAPPLARRRCVTWGLRSAGPAQLQRGQFWTPTRGHDWMLIDTRFISVRTSLCDGAIERGLFGREIVFYRVGPTLGEERPTVKPQQLFLGQTAHHVGAVGVMHTVTEAAFKAVAI